MRLLLDWQLVGSRADAFKHASEIAMSFFRGIGEVANYLRKHKVVGKAYCLRMS
jgi:hypothetical protein